MKICLSTCCTLSAAYPIGLAAPDFDGSEDEDRSFRESEEWDALAQRFMTEWNEEA